MIQHRSIFLSQQMLDVFLMLSVVGAAINCLIFLLLFSMLNFFNGTDPGSVPLNNVQHMFNVERLIVLCVAVAYKIVNFLKN